MPLVGLLINSRYSDDRIDLDIWIDRSKDGSPHNADCANVSLGLDWPFGVKSLHLHPENVGIGGQWRDTWNPSADTKEMCLFLEDDLEVSPYYFKWLKAAHDKYSDREDIHGFSLQRQHVKGIYDGMDMVVDDVKYHTFMYPALGTWGYSPKASVWRSWLDWYYKVQKEDPEFQPIMPGFLYNVWYQMFLRDGTASSMWEMWHLYYVDKRHLTCVYANPPGGKTLCSNWQEAGLHFDGSSAKPKHETLQEWAPELIDFPDEPLQLGWDGNPVIFEHALSTKVIRFAHKLYEDTKKDIVLAFVDDNSVDFARNWLCSTQKLRIHNQIVLICSDHAYTQLKNNEYVVATLNLHNQNDQSVVLLFQSLSHAKVDFWVADVDSIWLKSPLSLSDMILDKDIVISHDGLSSGIAFFKSSQSPAVSTLFSECSTLMKSNLDDSLSHNNIGMSASGSSELENLIRSGTGNVKVYDVSSKIVASVNQEQFSSNVVQPSTIRLNYEATIDSATDQAKKFGYWLLDEADGRCVTA